MAEKRFTPLHHFRHWSQCPFCRFSRSLAFSGIGAWLGYHGSIYLFNAPQFDAIIYAFFCALSLVLLTTPALKPIKRKTIRDKEI